MHSLDRLLSLVRNGDTIALEITGTPQGAQVVIAARLKGYAFDPEANSATNNLVRELTYPHLVQVAPGQSVSVALDLALDSLSGAQSDGLARLSEHDQAASRIREAADAAKAKPPTKSGGATGVKKVTVKDGTEVAEEEAAGDEGEVGSEHAAETATATAPGDAAVDTSQPAPSVFD